MRTLKSLKELARRKKVNVLELIYNEVLTFICDEYEISIDSQRLNDIKEDFISLFDEPEDIFDDYNENTSIKSLSISLTNYMCDITHDLILHYAPKCLEDAYSNWVESLDEKSLIKMYMTGDTYKLIRNMEQVYNIMKSYDK